MVDADSDLCETVNWKENNYCFTEIPIADDLKCVVCGEEKMDIETVSYTHLTKPVNSPGESESQYGASPQGEPGSVQSETKGRHDTQRRGRQFGID